MAKSKKLKFASRVIHVGGAPDKETGAIMPPIFMTSTYVQESPGVHKGYEYSRCHNPTRTRLEECLASLENAKYAMTFSSGLAAESILMMVLEPGARILCGDDVYGGTYRLFTKVFHERHKFEFVDTTDLKATEAKIKKFKPHLVWIESPTNPLLKISDIKKVSELAHKVKAKVLVDNTFMSPYFQNPLNLGADIVLHSMTKFINGHSDVVSGCMMYNDKELHDKFFYMQMCTGPTPSAFDNWLTLRGLKTLHVRMQTHEKNALKIAEFLEKHPRVEKVIYPGLKSHPQYQLAKKQMSGFGGMLTFFIKGGLKESRKFLETVELFSLAESLGGVESLVDHPAIMTHASVPKNIREEIGITDNLIRLSIGIEDADDLIEDLKNSLK